MRGSCRTAGSAGTRIACALALVAAAFGVIAGSAFAKTVTLNYTGGLQTFTVPAGVTSLRIEAIGAIAGPANSFATTARGASMAGDFTVAPGEQLTVLAGGAGRQTPGVPSHGGDDTNGSGGGGTFVWRGTGAVSAANLALAAGGGGGWGCYDVGTGHYHPGSDASTGPNGLASGLGTPGGTGGSGGGGGRSGFFGGGGGGAGILGNGGTSPQGAVSAGGGGGQAIALGGAGGTSPESAPGGFGGGGGASHSAAGGGGGYSGGGGGNAANGCDSGGGGGSFNAGTNQSNQVGAGRGNGSVTITWVDVTPPTITGSARSGGKAYTGGTWTNQDVVVHFACTDDDSGVASVTSDQTVSVGGADQAITGTCVDRNGNAASATFAGIDIDKTAPTIAASAISGGAGYTGGTWTGADVVVSFACIDAGGSGVTFASPDATVGGDGANQSVTGTCADAAGNSAATTFTSIDIDKTAPTITASATSGASAYASGSWTNRSVVVHFTCTDGGAGVDTVTADRTISGEGSGQSAIGNCTDKTGNTSSATFVGIDIDKTAPVIIFTNDGATFTVDQQVTLSCASNDALSGIATDTCTSISAPASSFSAGTHTVSATSTDKAGNATSRSANFTVVVTSAGLQSLIAQLSTDPAVTTSLTDKLSAIGAALERGQTKTAQNVIKAFQNQLSAQSGKALTATQAALLAALVGSL